MRNKQYMTNQEKSFTSYPIFIQDRVRIELGKGTESPNWDHLPSIKMGQALLWQNDKYWILSFFPDSLESDEMYSRLMLNI